MANNALVLSHHRLEAPTATESGELKQLKAHKHTHALGVLDLETQYKEWTPHASLTRPLCCSCSCFCFSTCSCNSHSFIGHLCPSHSF